MAFPSHLGASTSHHGLSRIAESASHSQGTRYIYETWLKPLANDMCLGKGVREEVIHRSSPAALHCPPSCGNLEGTRYGTSPVSNHCCRICNRSFGCLLRGPCKTCQHCENRALASNLRVIRSQHFPSQVNL